MKKIINLSVSMLLVLGLITGCGCNKKEKTNIKINNNIEEEVKKLNDEIMNSLVSVDENMLLTQFGLTIDEVEYYFAKIPSYNEIKNEFCIVIKPTSKTKDKVKNSLDMYVENLKNKADENNKKEYDNVLKEEYKGYYVYILSNDNNSIYKIIKNNLK